MPSSESDGDVWDAVTDTEFGKAPWALRVSKGDRNLRTVRLDPEITYIGRMAENHVVLDDPQVSRSHARITASKGRFILEDQQSENGVYVNEKRIQVHTLNLGDKIVIGTHVLEVVQAEEDVRAPVPEHHLEKLDAEWRMDQTVQVAGKALEELHKGLKSWKKTPKRSVFPTLDFSLAISETSYEDSITFDRGRKREGKDEGANFIEFRIGIGKWILYKKVPL